MDAKLQLIRNSTIKNFSSSIEWLLSFKNPNDILNDHWFAFLFELCIYGLFLIACQHASRRGTKSVCLLFTGIFAGFGGDVLQLIPNSGYQLWWYHQGMVNVFHVPLYGLCSVSVMYYYVDSILRRMNLPHLTQSLVNAIAATLLAFPCLCLAPNFLMILVHFDDPVFMDKLLNVPHMQLTHWFLMFFHLGHLFQDNFDTVEDEEKNLFGYTKCVLESGLLSGIYGIVEVYLLHMLVRLNLGLHIALIPPVGLVILMFFAHKEINYSNISDVQLTGLTKVLLSKDFLYIALFYVVITSIAFVVPAENMKSMGDHMDLGPCDVMESVANTSPLPTTRRRYICFNDTDEVHGFGFHCLQPQDLKSSLPQKEYYLCGGAIDRNTALCLLWYSVFCMVIFGFLLSVSVITAKRESLKFVKKLV